MEFEAGPTVRENRAGACGKVDVDAQDVQGFDRVVECPPHHDRFGGRAGAGQD